MKIHVNIVIEDDDDTSNFLVAKSKMAIDLKKNYSDRSFALYAITEYCKNVVLKSGINDEQKD